MRKRTAQFDYDENTLVVVSYSIDESGYYKGAIELIDLSVHTMVAGADFDVTSALPASLVGTIEDWARGQIEKGL